MAQSPVSSPGNSERGKYPAQEKLEALLADGIQSGEPAEMTRQDWCEIRGEALRIFEFRTTASAEHRE